MFDRDQDEDNLDVQVAMHLRPRHISEEQMRKFENDVSAILTAFGLDLDTPATRDTPRRFLRAMFDATEGYEGDPKLLTVFETECRGGPDCRLSQVIEGPIHFLASVSTTRCPFTAMPTWAISRTSTLSVFPSSRAWCACLPGAL